jgi:SNF2 family DNA or RNA helicase
MSADDNPVLVLLLRLRQICSHPALIQEGEAALIAPDEMDESITPEIRDELSRARNLVGLEFVAKMKLKLKTRRYICLATLLPELTLVIPVPNLHGRLH